LYSVGAGPLGQIEIGPGIVTLIGGSPGAGKTAFVMQCVVNALRLDETLRVCVCNVEMSAETLFDRQLARISGIDLSSIRHRRLTAMHSERLDTALEPLTERLCFVRPPFGLADVAAAAEDGAFEADIIVLDYIQRISPPDANGDKRSEVDATMNYIRQFADVGIAVIVVAAVSRTRDRQGRSSYDGSGLNLASFRESSELEFGADDAFILCPDSGQGSTVTLRHLKARNGEPRDVRLEFDRTLQRFSPVDGVVTPENAASTSTLSELWGRTTPAPEEPEQAE
jgi:replicative DNA helicase